MIKHVLLALLTIIALSSFALGLGMSPAEKTINFESGKTVQLDFFIINSEGNDFNASLSSNGELSKYLFFEESIVHVRPNDYRTPITATINLPQMLEPGLHTFFIRVTPVLESSQDAFRAYVAPEVPVTVRVPYPEKYAAVDVSVLNVDEGTLVPINLEFDNLGSEDIDLAGGDITVYSFDGKLLNKMTAPGISVAANSFGKSEGNPKAALSNGLYYLKSNAYYDDVHLSIQKNFSIGSPDADLKRLLTQRIKMGEISKVEFKTSLDWNVPIEASIVTSLGGVESQTPVFMIPPGESDVTAFVDATNLENGTMNFNARLIYGSQIKEFNFEIKVVGEGEATTDTGLLFIWILVIILILVLAGLIYWYFKKNQNPPSEPQVLPESPASNSSSESRNL